MPKCDFNKVTMQRYWNHTSAWVFSCKFAPYFPNTFRANIYLFKVKNRNNRKRCEICSKSTITNLEQPQGHWSNGAIA